jgi:dTDP-4-dehydrorhamnose reductase
LRVALLGANGQLGSDIHAAFPGDEVTTFRRSDFDVRDFGRARERLLDCRPDVIVNTTALHKLDACEQDPDSAFAINATAPSRLAALARELRAQFVHMSSDYVYGGLDVRSLTEAVPPAPVQVYGATKAAGEWLVLLANPDALIVRSSGLYGIAGASGKGGNFVQLVVRLAREKGEMRIVHDQFLSPTYTADLALAIVKLIERKASGIFHVTNSDSCSWYEFACHIVASMNVRASVRPVSTVEFGDPVRRPLYSVLDNARWREERLQPLRPWRYALGAYLEAKGIVPAAARSRA